MIKIIAGGGGLSKPPARGAGDGVSVAEGERIDVTLPVYRFRSDAAAATQRDDALEVWTPPLSLPMADQDE